jgi:hypothetical protein
MRPLLVYAALVGLPVAGLAVVLHAGRALSAPPSLAGEWQLVPPGYVRRAQAAVDPEHLRVTVSQSGTELGVTVMRREFRGRLSGDSLPARGGRQVGVFDTCWDAPDAVLHARFDTAAAPQRMEIAFAARWPSPCEGPFTAVRR